MRRIVKDKWFSAPVDLYKKYNSHDLENLQLETPELPPFRSIFDRDRDRILFSKAFRRLNGKTQIFIPHTHDYIRTRLTHSLEVNQIGRTIGKGLGLNLSLIEAIALGHDVGHTPFGHAGEFELNRIMNNCAGLSILGFPILKEKEKGFKHNFQSIRSLHKLSYLYGSAGLHLTPFTYWGILNHTKLFYKDCEYNQNDKCTIYNKPENCINQDNFSVSFYDDLLIETIYFQGKQAWTFEGLVVGIADEIAQIHHDIEDSIFMRIISLNEAKSIVKDFINSALSEFPQLDLNNYFKEKLDLISKSKDHNEFMSYTSKTTVDLLVSKMITEGLHNLNELSKKYNIQSHADYNEFYFDISMDDIIRDPKNTINNKIIPFNQNSCIKEFQEKFQERVIHSEEVQKLNNLGQKVILDLFTAFYSNPKILADSTIIRIAEECEEANKIISEVGLRRIQSDAEEYLSRQKQSLGKIRSKISDILKENKNQKKLVRIITDHIAGMTDEFALARHKEIYGSDFGL